MGMEQGGYIEGDEQGTYGYGGGGDFNLSMGAGGDDYSIDIGGAPIDFGDSDFFYGYGFDTGAEYGDSGYQPGGGGDDLFGAYYDYYMGLGLDPAQAATYAAEDASAGSVETITSEQGNLPDISNQPFYGLPYIPDPFLTPYTPIFPDLPPPIPPQQPLPPSPATQQPSLPPACPGGQYHPYPIGHPQQNICIPFPLAQTSSTPSPPRQTAPAPVPAPKPPAQQSKCPQGQYRDPATGQCKSIPQGQPQSCPTGYYRASSGQCLPIPRCTTPGTVFDAARGICVPQGQAISPLPSGEFDDLFSNLKEIPWWIWLALGGLFLLSREDDSGKKTTVTYRRAR